MSANGKRLDDVAKLFGVARYSVVRWVKAGKIKSFGRPARVPLEDVRRLCKERGVRFPGAPVRKKPVRKLGNRHALVNLDFAKIGDEELADAEKRLKAEKIAEEIKKKRKESGELVERQKVDEALVRLAASVRSLYLKISDGFANGIAGKTPPEIQAELNERLDRYGQELRDLKWRDF